MEEQRQPARERIRSRAKERKPVPMVVPEWEETVHIRLLSAGEVLDLTSEGTPQRELIFGLLIATLEDEGGELIFTEEDRRFLEDEPFQLILRVFKESAIANGLPAGELEKAMEDLGPTPDAAS